MPGRRNILVTGATGKQGQKTIQALFQNDSSSSGQVSKLIPVALLATGRDTGKTTYPLPSSKCRFVFFELQEQAGSRTYGAWEIIPRMNKKKKEKKRVKKKTTTEQFEPKSSAANPFVG